MRMPVRTVLAAAAVFALASTASAQQNPAFQHPEPRIHRLENAALLTGPSKDSSRAIVVRALRERGADESALASLVFVSEARNAQTGIVDVRLEQRVAGLSVYDTYVRAALTASGEVIQIIDSTVPVPRALPGTRASAQQALRAALRQLHPEFLGSPSTRAQNGNTTVFAGGSFFHADPTVTRVAVPLTDGSMRQGFLVETWSEERNLLNHTLVDGDATVLAVEPRTTTDTYKIFKQDPEATPQEEVAGPGAGNAESPAGWLFGGIHRSVDIAGNNARAYLDTDANNAADAGGTTVGDGNFLATADLSAEPSTAANKAVATQNLFYLNNVLHDLLYAHGFIEAEGNFQENNFGKGGRGSDSVNAEAQDGSGTDNANFATPPDGQNPRMQMFLWSGRPSHFVQVNSRNRPRYDAAGAEFGATLDTIGLTGDVVLANDGTGTTSDACEALVGFDAGKIALIDRGTCTFVIKVKNAQNAGAIGAIVINNQGDATIVMGGSDRTITIPAVFVGQTDGDDMRGGVNATMKASGLLSRDGDLDSDIVYHEYGHGLTWRMIGRMSGPMAGAVGEGMSDVLSIVINEDDAVGEYSFTDPVGIRTARYTNYPRTYGDVTGSEVHFDGEVYAAIGWRLWEIFRDDRSLADPKSLLFDYLVQGMTFTPAGPTFEAMRDGILTAVGVGGQAHQCHVWRAFAKYGVGVGAQAQVRGSSVTVTESFAVPAGCPAP